MSFSSYTHPIRDLLANLETPLGKLISQAHAIDALNQQFHTLIDPALVPHCRVGTFNNSILTLFTDNAAYATRLRYQIPTILSQLRHFPQWAGLRSIQIKIQTYHPCAPRTVSQSALPDTSHTHSTAFISQVEELVSTLKNNPGNEALISSLERLLK